MKQKTFYQASDGRRFFPCDISALDVVCRNNKEAYEACIRHEEGLER